MAPVYCLRCKRIYMYVIVTLNTGCRYMTYYGPTEHLALLKTQILNLKCGDGQPLKTIIPLLESI